MAYYGTFNASSKNNASISFCPSIDIVITDNQDLWTRCPVMELGKNSVLNVGGATDGELRKSQVLKRMDLKTRILTLGCHGSQDMLLIWRQGRDCIWPR